MAQITISYPPASWDFNLGRSWKYIKDTDDDAGITYSRVESGDSPKSFTRNFTIDSSVLPTQDYTISKAVLKWTGTYSKVNKSYIGSEKPTVDGKKFSSGEQSYTITDATLLNNIKNERKLPLVFKYWPSTSLPFSTQNSSIGETGASSFYYWKQFTLEIHYTLNYIKLTTPTITSSSQTLRKDQSYILQWSKSVSSGSNSVREYQVFLNGSHSYTVSSNTTTFTISGENLSPDAATSLQIKAVSTEGGDAYNSNLSNIIIVRRYKDFIMPELYLHTSANNLRAKEIYIGESDIPIIIASWEINNLGGNYDSIESLKLNGVELSTTTTFSEINSNTNEEQTLEIKMTSGYTDVSSAFIRTANTIGTEDFVFSVDTSEVDKVGPISSYEWGAANSEHGQVKYYCEVVGSVYKEIIEDTNKILNLEGIIKNNETFLFQVTPRIYPSYGGYTQIENSISLYRSRAKKPVITDTSILLNTDLDNLTYCYNNVQFTIKQPDEINYPSLSPEEREYNKVEVKVDKQSAPLNGLDGKYEHDTSIFPEGTIFEYSVLVENSYGETNSKVYSVIRFIKPSVIIDSITESDVSVNLSFTITPSPHSGQQADDTSYWLQIQYGNTIFSLADTTWEYKNSISLLKDDLVKSVEDLKTALSGANEQQPIAFPRVEFTMFVYDNKIEKTRIFPGVYTRNFTIDYRVLPKIIKFEVSENTPTYPTTYDDIAFNVELQFQDAGGGSNSNYLEYEIQRAYPYSVIEGAAAKDTLGMISADTTYEYTLVAVYHYKDTDVYVSSEKYQVPIYKLINPTFQVTNLEWREDGLGGKITYDLNCSKIDIIGSYQCQIRYESETEAKNEIILKHENDDVSLQGVLDFTAFKEMDSKEVELYFDFSTTSNTGKASLSTTLGPFIVRAASIPLSIRKYGVGIHAEKDFNPDINCAALRVVGNVNTDNVAEFVNGDSAGQATNITLNFNNQLAHLSLQSDEQGDLFFTIVFPE